MWHGRHHYGYQAKIRRALIRAAVLARHGHTIIVPIEVPRQSGKTQAVVDTEEFLLTCHARYLGAPIATGIFAPQREQATTDFERLRTQFTDLAPLGLTTSVRAYDVDGKRAAIELPAKWNSKTIRLYQKNAKYLGEVYIFPISKTSRSESKSFGKIVIEEAQDVNDELMKNTVFPMGASTNAPRILIGTAGTRLCYFKSQLDTNPLALRITLAEVFADRRAVYDKTGNATHLLYEKFIENEIRDHGKDSDYIQRQYFCKWIIGTGNFMTADQWNALQAKGKFGDDGFIEGGLDPDATHYFGLDTAKRADRTWCFVVQEPKEPGAKARIVGILVLKSKQGINYEEQFETLQEWLGHVPNLRAGAIDSTSQGDFMPDLFERRTPYNLIRFTFSASSKDALYKNLENVVQQKTTEIPSETPRAPDGEMDPWLMMRKECLELEKQYRGRLMAVAHPEKDADGREGHDDAPDAWALAEWAMAETIRTSPRISF